MPCFARLLLALTLIAAACRPAASPRPPDEPTAPAADDGAQPVEPDPPPQVREPQDLSGLLESIVARRGVPGLGAAVIDREGVAALGVAGRRRAGEAEPLRPDDRFHLGSDTKAMTAYVVARLVERGELHRDDALGSLFPEAGAWMHADFRAVTLDQLLTHRGGVPGDLAELQDRVELDPEAPPDVQREVLVRAALARPAASPAGTAFAYSNLGYIIVGAALKARTGASWESLMQRELFEPLEMRSCGFGPVGTPQAPDNAWAHERESEGYRPVDIDNPAYLGPAGTVHCSLADWGRFAQAMFDGGPGLQPDTRAWLRSPVKADGESYARGWMVRDAFSLGDTIIAHDGSNTVNYASIVIAPHRGVAFLAACNAGDKVAQSATVDVMLSLMKAYQRPAE